MLGNRVLSSAVRPAKKVATSRSFVTRSKPVMGGGDPHPSKFSCIKHKVILYDIHSTHFFLFFYNDALTVWEPGPWPKSSVGAYCGGFVVGGSGELKSMKK